MRTGRRCRESHGISNHKVLINKQTYIKLVSSPGDGYCPKKNCSSGDILDKLGKGETMVIIPGLMDNTQELFLFFICTFFWFLVFTTLHWFPPYGWNQS